MKIIINKEIIKSLKPCANRYENYLKHYSDFEGYLEEFLDLEHISHTDKIWLSVRVMPMFLAEVFAIDCAVNAIANTNSVADAAAAYAATAYAATAAAYAAYAATDVAAAYAAAAYAAYAAAAADAAAAYAERQRQIESIIYLVQSYKE